jgi:hypothetical protein
MRNLRLSGTPFDAPEDVVRWLVAVQSQDYGPAKWSVAQRTHRVSDAVMDRALADGTILRTHVLRPTWHFVLPADIRWLLELTAPRVQALNAYMYRQFELDGAVLKKCNVRLVRALQGGNQLTRRELEAVLNRAGIATNGFRLAYILMNAELNGIICSGALNGKQHTHALLNERVLQAKRLTRDEALAELTLRYFASHGPATAKDFKSWSSLTAADIKKGLEMVAAQLEHEIIDGLSCWFVTSAACPKAASPAVHLLQGYDEYVMGYSESKYLLDVSGNAKSFPKHQTVFNGVVILDSQVAGRWKRTLEKSSVVIDVALYKPFSRAQTKALQAAADRHAEFLGLTVAVLRRETHA